MAFNVTYHGLSKSNIKHLYCGRVESKKLPSVKERQAERLAKRVHETLFNKPSPWEKFQSSRKLNYDPETNVISPKSNSSNLCSRSRLYTLMSKLGKPTRNSYSRVRSTNDKESLKTYTRTPCTVLNWSEVDWEDVYKMSKRLAEPTFSSYVRSVTRSRRKLSPKPVFNCEKCYLAPSGPE